MHDLDPGPDDQTTVAKEAKARIAAETPSPSDVSAADDAPSLLDRANGLADDLMHSPVAKVGGTALLVASVGLDIWDVAKAPPAEKAHIAIHDAGTLAGGLAGAAYGATIGTAICPGVGTFVGGVIGGVIGSGAGGMLADGVENTWNTVSSWF